MVHLSQVDARLRDITGEQIWYKDCTQYAGTKWVQCNSVTASYPVQRMLTSKEIVIDLDDIDTELMLAVTDWLRQMGFKFTAWQTSATGMHIHFWTDVTGKHQKKHVAKFIADTIEAQFAIKPDLLPMGHGFIRCEGSVHPEKGTTKTLLVDNVPTLDPLNTVPDKLRKQLDIAPMTFGNSNSKLINGKMPKCMRYILSHQFSDGRQRMLFTIVSWYKANGYSDKDNVRFASEWARRQGLNIPTGKIWAFVRSTNGSVGCTYRHGLLEEIGVDIGKCELVDTR